MPLGSSTHRAGLCWGAVGAGGQQSVRGNSPDEKGSGVVAGDTGPCPLLRGRAQARGLW